LLEYEPKIKSTDGEVPDRAEEDIKGEISLKGGKSSIISMIERFYDPIDG